VYLSNQIDKMAWKVPCFHHWSWTMTTSFSRMSTVPHHFLTGVFSKNPIMGSFCFHCMVSWWVRPCFTSCDRSPNVSSGVVAMHVSVLLSGGGAEPKLQYSSTSIHWRNSWRQVMCPPYWSTTGDVVDQHERWR
jgi:hypothetical protein